LSRSWPPSDFKELERKAVVREEQCGPLLAQLTSRNDVRNNICGQSINRMEGGSIGVLSIRSCRSSPVVIDFSIVRFWRWTGEYARFILWTAFKESFWQREPI